MGQAEPSRPRNQRWSHHRVEPQRRVGLRGATGPGGGGMRSGGRRRTRRGWWIWVDGVYRTGAAARPVSDMFYFKGSTIRRPCAMAASWPPRHAARPSADTCASPKARPRPAVRRASAARSLISLPGARLSARAFAIQLAIWESGCASGFCDQNLRTPARAEAGPKFRNDYVRDLGARRKTGR